MEPDHDLARQLHDYSVGLIQDLFRTSVRLKSADAGSELAPGVLSQVLNDMDESINALRLRVFTLEAPPAGQAKDVWTAVRDLCQRAEMCLGVPVRLSRRGSVDAVVSPRVLSDVTGVVCSALSLAMHVARSLEISMQVAEVLLVDIRLVGVTHLDDHRVFLGQMAAAARQCGSVHETETLARAGAFWMHWAIPLPERL